MLNDHLDALDRRVLGHVLVHVQALLGRAPLAEVDAEVEEADHDGFQRGERRLPEPLGREDFGDGAEGRQGLADREKLIGALWKDRAKSMVSALVFCAKNLEAREIRLTLRTVSGLV